MSKKLVLLLVLLLVLSGCGGQQGQEVPARDMDGAVGTGEWMEADGPGGAEALPVARPEVENNGGNFVRVGEKVWFRRHGSGLEEQSFLWGDFLSALPADGYDSELCYYDTEGDAILTAFPDPGAGPLWFGEGGFYLTRVGEEQSHWAYFADLDGTRTELCEARVAAVSENGAYAALIAESGPESGTLYLYSGPVRLQSCGPEYDEYFRPCAVTDEGALLYLSHSYRTGMDFLCQLDADGSACRLGEIPQYPGAGELEIAPEPGQFLRQGEMLYFVFPYARAFTPERYGGVCMRAVFGRPNSLEVYQGEEPLEEGALPWMLDAGDEVLLFDAASDRVELSEGAYGDLLWLDSPFSAVELIRDFLPYNPLEDGGVIVQTMERVGDAAYLVAARERRSPAWDAGWEMAFRPEEVYYLRVPLHEDSRAEGLGCEVPDLSMAAGGMGSLAFGRADEVIDGLWLCQTPEETVEQLGPALQRTHPSGDPDDLNVLMDYEGMQLGYYDIFGTGESLLGYVDITGRALGSGVGIGAALEEVLAQYPDDGERRPVGSGEPPWGYYLYGEFMSWFGMPEQYEQTGYICQRCEREGHYSVCYECFTPVAGGCEQATLAFYFDRTTDRVDDIVWSCSFLPGDPDNPAAYG